VKLHRVTGHLKNQFNFGGNTDGFAAFFYQYVYFAHDTFAIGWMYGFHGFAPIGTDFF
jgi:hypothetical protein